MSRAYVESEAEALILILKHGKGKDLEQGQQFGLGVLLCFEGRRLRRCTALGSV